jgi:hypothetical protein
MAMKLTLPQVEQIFTLAIEVLVEPHLQVIDSVTEVGLQQALSIVDH